MLTVSMTFPAVFGLGKAVEYLGEIGGLAEIYKRICNLLQMLMDGLKNIPGITIYGPADAERRAGVVTFNKEGHSFHKVALYLNEHNIGVIGTSVFIVRGSCGYMESAVLYGCQCIIGIQSRRLRMYLRFWEKIIIINQL